MVESRGMLGTLFSDPLFFLIYAIAIVVSITIHEFAHAWMADRLGDPTPKIQDRLSLNPLKHLDPIGTLALLITRFGWGRPVEFDPYNLRHPKRDTALIALAGPASNLLLAAALSLILHTVGLPPFLAELFVFTITIGVFLALFNLIPIHPLDGGKIAIGLLPHDLAVEWDRTLHRYGMFILLILIFPWGNSQSPVSYLILPVAEALLKIFLG